MGPYFRHPQYLKPSYVAAATLPRKYVRKMYDCLLVRLLKVSDFLRICAECICKASFLRINLIHLGERPYVCQVEGCEKKFTEYSSLYKHHVVHTHNKPYTCTLCNKTYRQASTLALHKRTSHGDLSDLTMADAVGMVFSYYLKTANGNCKRQTTSHTLRFFFTFLARLGAHTTNKIWQRRTFFLFSKASIFFPV